MKLKWSLMPTSLRWSTIIAMFIVGLILIGQKCCTSVKAPMTKLEGKRDSVPVLLSLGVSALISDSGYIKYRIIAEEWKNYDKTRPPRQEFPKGLFMQRFNRNYQMDFYMVSDSAWCYDQYLWRFKGNVLIKDLSKNTTITTQELFWDRQQHKFYSNSYIKIVEPDQQLEGNRFWANEQMTQYEINTVKGFMPTPQDNKTNTISGIKSTEGGDSSKVDSFSRIPVEPYRKNL